MGNQCYRCGQSSTVTRAILTTSSLHTCETTTTVCTATPAVCPADRLPEPTSVQTSTAASPSCPPAASEIDTPTSSAKPQPIHQHILKLPSSLLLRCGRLTSIL